MLSQREVERVGREHPLRAAKRFRQPISGFDVPRSRFGIRVFTTLI